MNIHILLNRDKCKMNIHILHIHMTCKYVCILSASCEQDCNFVSARVCVLVVFIQVVPHLQCVWWLRPTQYASRRSICPSHHEYLDPFTLCLAPRSHCATFSLAPCRVSRSHRVVCLARTVLLSSVLLLPGLSLTQCKRSTQFISSHTSRRDVFLCITPRSHSVFFIVVAVYRVALWRANLSLTQCRVPRSNCTLILRNASL